MKILFYILQLRKQHFIITDTKLYVSVVILSIQNNAKLSQQLMPDFKRTINWNKYQSNVSTKRQKPHLDYLIDPSFQRVNRLFVLSFADNDAQDIFFQK